MVKIGGEGVRFVEASPRGDRKIKVADENFVTACPFSGDVRDDFRVAEL